MRASVKAAWPAVCKEFEGRLDCMYLDVKGLVTTGTGNLIDSVAAAQALPWLTKDGKPATNAQIAAEWKQIKARQSSKGLGGYAFVKWATLHIDDATIDRLLFEVTDKFWSRLGQTLAKIETFPADAQLVLLDESWQNGPAFLDAGTAWTGTRAAVLAQDWKAAATHVPGTGRRADRRKRLFNNAAAVVTLGIDPDVLWDQRVPIKSVAPAPPKEDPVVKYAPRHGKALAAYAKSRVGDSYGQGWCQKFTNECGQTGSVGDYDGDKAADAEDGWKKAVAKGKVVKAADVKYADIPPGVYHYWTGGGSDHGHAAPGVGGRRIVSTDLTDDGPRYGHIGECDLTMPRIHWGLTYAGYALIEGNGYTLTDPPENTEEIDDMPTPKDVAAELATNDKFLDAIAARVTAAVWAADVIPNTGLTSNKENKNVTPGTAFSQIGKKVDAVAASVAATFPNPAA